MKLTTIVSARLKLWNKQTSKAVKPSNIVRQWSDELMIGTVVKTSTVGVSQQPCAQVAVTRNEYNTYLHRYFPNVTNFWALDDRQAAGSNRFCQLGDLVSIRKLIEPFTVKVTHRLENRVFEHGRIVDPISKKRIYESEYEDLRKAKKNIVDETIGKRLTARQLAAARLGGKEIEQD